MPEVRVKVIKTREQLYSHVDTWYFWLWKGGLKGCSSLGTGLALRATLYDGRGGARRAPPNHRALQPKTDQW